MLIKIKDTWVEFQVDEKDVVSNMPKEAWRFAYLHPCWSQDEKDKWMDEGSLAETGLDTGKTV